MLLLDLSGGMAGTGVREGQGVFVRMAGAAGGVGQGGPGVCCTRADVVGWLDWAQAVGFPGHPVTGLA